MEFRSVGAPLDLGLGECDRERASFDLGAGGVELGAGIGLELGLGFGVVSGVDSG
jgi:hypothetical protein